ncbi:MAG: hypothetical protein ACT4O5_09590 [Gammaproteobacteria bacterium]
MIIGAHSIIYSASPAADRAFLRDVLRLPNVDVGDGWMIFGLPPAEVAEMKKRKVACGPAQDRSPVMPERKRWARAHRLENRSDRRGGPPLR